MNEHAIVVAVSRSQAHAVSKTNQPCIRLIPGFGVEGDAHYGVTVQHLSRMTRDPNQPNLRQVHLLHSELLDKLGAAGFTLAPGQMGENITTRGIHLLTLPAGTRLHLGTNAIVQVTGMRNPCAQLDELQPGLMQATLERDAAGNLIRKAGVMCVVVEAGEVRPGDPIAVEFPSIPHAPLAPV